MKFIFHTIEMIRIIFLLTFLLIFSNIIRLLNDNFAKQVIQFFSDLLDVQDTQKFFFSFRIYIRISSFRIYKNALK